MDKHMEWLLSLAASVRSKFYDDSIENNIKKYLYECIAENKGTEESITVVTDSVLNGSAPFWIITNNPKKVYNAIIIKLQNNLSDTDKCKFRPLTIITKLANREFIFDIGGNQLIYGISSKYADDNLVKSIICRNMYMIKNYFDHVDNETHSLLPSAIEKIQNVTIDGGKRSHKKQKVTPRINIKVKILGRLVDYVKTNSVCMNSLIYLNDLENVDNHAMDIIYSDNRAKDCVIDYLKLLVQNQYPDYKFEINPHQGYFVPFDFRLRKLSCLIKNRKTNQTSYLVNMYNAAMYDPIPSFRIMDQKNKDTNACQLVAHPLVRLRFLYLDKFLLGSKDKSNGLQATNTFNMIIQKMIDTTINELINLKNRTPTWAGIYRDENYDRNQENMRSNIPVPYEVIII